MPAPQPPRGLRAWGEQLWTQVTESSTFDPAGYFILAEACRTADVIERLSGMYNSNSTVWVALADEAVQVAMTETGGQAVEINLSVNPVLAEARQQRLALRQLLAQLKLGKTEDDTGDDDPIAKLMADFALPD
ncbi:hypothetical protein HNP02_007204 [Mycobacterium sp. AZCC_0083]|nr:hypothetical protein [Mycobacterium sp. AZCC_0083]